MRSAAKEKRKRVLMIVENSYPFDIRVRREAEAVQERFDVTVISIKRSGQKFHEIVDRVEVYRLPRIESGDERAKRNWLSSVGNRIGYIVQYLFFTLAAAVIFAFTLPFRKYRVIHVHNPPDTLFFIGMIGKLFGIRFVYDHHDLAPELYLTKFGGRKDFIYRVMLWCEKLSCRLADVVISTNESYRQLEVARHGVDAAQTFVVRNDPVASEFQPAGPVEQECGESAAGRGTINLLYLGSINPQDGVDVLLRALAQLRSEFHREDFACTIVGAGDALKMVRQLASELKIDDKVEFTGMVKDRSIIGKYMRGADICLEPAPENELNRHSTFIKVLEYMSAARPIVAFDLQETRYSAGDAAMLVRPNDIHGFVGAIVDLMDSEALRHELGQNGRRRIEAQLNWDTASRALSTAYDHLRV